MVRCLIRSTLLVAVPGTLVACRALLGVDREGTTDTTPDASGDASDTADADAGVAPFDAAAIFAFDDFEVPHADGLGEAKIGGSWLLDTTAAGAFSVRDGSAFLRAGATQTVKATIGTDVSDVDVTASFSISEVPAAALYMGLLARATSGSMYELLVKIPPSKNQATTLKFGSDDNSAESSFVVSPNVPFKLHMQIQGRAPSNLRGRIWRGETEPNEWQAQATYSAETDSGALDLPSGQVGFQLYYDGDGGTGTVAFHDFTARRL